MSNRQATPISSTEHHRFFGYFDICPWNAAGSRILTHEVNRISSPPEIGDEARIAVVDASTGNRKVVGTTTAWNFQLGSRLQWIGPEYKGQILFNDRNKDGLVTRIVDIQSAEQRTLGIPVYAAFPDGSKAVTFDFERLHETRPGYGYPAARNYGNLEPIPEGSGLRVVDLEDGTTEQLVSFDDLLALNPVPTMNDGNHWINHILISPSGEQISFFHRWELSDGGMYTRLCTVSRDGTDLKAVIDTGRVTHYAWRSEEEILAWSRESDVLNDAAKEGGFDHPLVNPLVNTVRYVFNHITVPSWLIQDVLGEGYFIYQVKSEREPSRFDLHNVDGHPSFSPDREWVLFDTYPAAKDRRGLYIYGMETGEKHELGSFHSPSEYNGTRYRCDLHPRWNRNGTAICFDSIHDGKRDVYTMDVSDIVET